MKVYGVYYYEDYNNEDMQVFKDKEKAQEFFEKIKNDLKEYKDENATDNETEYCISFYDFNFETRIYFVKLKEFEI